MKNGGDMSENFNSRTVEVIAGLSSSPTPPEVGMLFNSLEDLHDMYQRYARDQGFQIIKASRSNDKEGKPQFATLACHRSRYWKGRSGKGLRALCTKKSGCKAKVCASRVWSGAWKVNKVCDQHNHLLDVSVTRFIRQHQVFSPCLERRLEIDDIVVEAGGTRNWRLRKGGAEALSNMFIKMKQLNEDFFYAIDCDEDSRIRNIVWVDTRSRAAYKEFCDVVCFDSTYLVNKYEIPFAAFVGVNHHRQYILLGCALISDEEVKTYSWVFSTWLKCMNGVAPKAIITDQCRSMRKAIQEILPETRHRWCLWYIMRKLPEKFRRKERYSAFRSRFKDVVYESDSPNDFDNKWLSMVKEFSLSENAWLNSLFEHKEMWAPAFMRDTFWAGMQPTQRSESMHSYFDEFVHRSNSLKQFLEQYEIALRDKIDRESQAEEESAAVTVSPRSSYGWEEQFQKVYTKEIYSLFREEVINLLYCVVIDESVNNDEKEYEYKVLERICDDQSVFHEKKLNVRFVVETCETRCSCYKFERIGILCRHALAVLVRRGVNELPESYILRRWRKDVFRAYLKIGVGFLFDDLDPSRKTLRELENVFYDAAFGVLEDKENVTNLMKVLLDFRNNLGGELLVSNKRGDGISGPKHSSCPKGNGELVPNREGRPRSISNKRTKNGKETSADETNVSKPKGSKLKGLKRKGKKLKLVDECMDQSQNVDGPDVVEEEIMEYETNAVENCVVGDCNVVHVCENGGEGVDQNNVVEAEFTDHPPTTSTNVGVGNALVVEGNAVVRSGIPDLNKMPTA